MKRSAARALVGVAGITGIVVFAVRRSPSKVSPPAPVPSEVSAPAPFTSLDEVLQFLTHDAGVQACVFGSTGRSQAWFVFHGKRLGVVAAPCGEEWAPVEIECLERALARRARVGLLPERTRFLLSVVDRRLAASFVRAEVWPALCPTRPTKSLTGAPPGVP